MFFVVLFLCILATVPIAFVLIVTATVMMLYSGQPIDFQLIGHVHGGIGYVAVLASMLFTGVSGVTVGASISELFMAGIIPGVLVGLGLMGVWRSHTKRGIIPANNTVEKLKSEGAVINELPDEARAEFEKATAGVWDEVAKDLGSDLVAEFKSEIESAEKKYEKQFLYRASSRCSVQEFN